MGHGLHDLARHNAWATLQLLDYCGELDSSMLNATSPGTYGAILETLQHIVDPEASYLWRLTGAWPAHPWQDDEAVGLDVLAERATILGTTLDRFLAGEWDSEVQAEARDDDGEVFAVPVGILLAQALHHASEHRAHVCTILGAQGYQPPSVSAWGYAFDSGRATLKKAASGG
jgi:uncharacterized damage-inducible protein DinB